MLLKAYLLCRAHFPIRLAVLSNGGLRELDGGLLQVTQEFGPIREAQGRGIHAIDVHRLAVRVGAPEGRGLPVLDLQSGSILVGPR